MTERQPTVALLIDYDNLQICYSRDAPGTQLDLGAVMALAQSYGRVIVARAYAEWNLLCERLAVYKSGIEPAFAPVLRPENSSREGKSLADTVMVADGVDLLWRIQPDVLVMVTSDKDMIPLVRLAKMRGTLVVVLGSDLTAMQLIEMANDFVTYRHLVRELGRPEERAPLNRMREEPRLRRVREPVGSREVAAARQASQREPRVPQNRVRQRMEAPPRVEAIAPIGPIAPPAPFVPEPMLPASTSLATIESDEGAPILLDEAGQPIVPRRRRRRGGRGRRSGLASEGFNRPSSEAFGESEESGPDEDPDSGEALSDTRPGTEVAGPVGQQVEAESGPAPDQATSESGEPVASERTVRRPSGTRRAPSRARTPRPESDSLESTAAAPDTDPESPVAAEPRPEQQLRPWERWPETSPRLGNPPKGRNTPSRAQGATVQAASSPTEEPAATANPPTEEPVVTTGLLAEEPPITTGLPVEEPAVTAGRPVVVDQAADLSTEAQPATALDGSEPVVEGAEADAEQPAPATRPRRPRRRAPARKTTATDAPAEESS